jgi:hypothetical protein
MRAIAAIGVKLMGVYFVISSVSTAPLAWFSWSTVNRIQPAADPDLSAYLSLFFAPLVLALAGAGLIVWGNGLAGMLCRGVPEATSSKLASSQLLQTGLVLMGVYFVAVGLPGVATYVWWSFETMLNAGTIEASAAEDVLSSRMSQNFTGAVIRVATGLVLIGIAKPLSRMSFAKQA